MRNVHWGPVQDDNVFLEGRSIWSRTVKTYGLRVDRERAIRARYPNQNPETMMQYAPLSGWVLAPSDWDPPKKVANAADISRQLAVCSRPAT